MRVGSALFVLLTACVLLPAWAGAWGNEQTHPRLTDAGVSHATEFDRVLREVYGLEDGLSTKLAVQEGFAEERGFEGLDDDLTGGFFGFSRLSRDKSVFKPEFPFLFTNVFLKPARDVRVPVNDRCERDGGFESCEESLERAAIDQLLRAGVFAEDNPNVRASHHFHDPVRLHDGPSPVLPGAPEVPAGNRGLDNTSGVWLRQFAQEAPIDVVTRVLRGGGTFRLIGRSAKDRALNRPESDPASRAEPRNFFSLADAERYLHLGLTASRADEREHWMALHFIAVGSVLHLLEDMGSVAHVRNDFLNDHVWALFSGGGPNLETAGEKRSLVRFIEEELEPEDANLGESIPAADVPDGAFAENLPLLGRSKAMGAEIADFWDERPFGSTGGRGLAEIVNRGFFSRATVDDRFDRSDPEGSPATAYPSPPVPDGSQVDTEPPPAGGVAVLPLPRRDLLSGDLLTQEAENPPCFLSRRLVPHLARCRFHRQPHEGATILERDLDAPFTVIDESVQRDYLEILFPLTIDYTARFLERYFAPRLEVLPEGPRRFRLANRTRLPMRFHRDAIEVIYDSTRVDQETGQRIRERAPISCDATGGDVLELGPAGEGERWGPPSGFVCELPQSLEEPAHAPGAFWVLLRGSVGERGRAEPPAEPGLLLGRSVVAFDRVVPEIVFDDRVPAAGSEPATDETETVDVYALRLEPGGEVAPDEPAPEAVNLTAPLREALERPELDFAAPARRPGSQQLAVWGDRDVPPQQSDRLFGDGFFYDILRLDRRPSRDDPGRLQAVPGSRFDTFGDGSKAWSPDGSLLAFPTRPDASSEPEWILHDIITGEQTVLTTPGAFAIVQEKAETVVVEGCAAHGDVLGRVLRVVPIDGDTAVVDAGCTVREKDRDTGESVAGLLGVGATLFRADIEATAPGEARLALTDAIGLPGAGAAVVACELSGSLPYESELRSECPVGLSETAEKGVRIVERPDGGLRAAFIRVLGDHLLDEPFPQQDVVVADLASSLGSGSVQTVVTDVGRGVQAGYFDLAPGGTDVIYGRRPKQFYGPDEVVPPATLFRIDLSGPPGPREPKRAANGIDVLTRLYWGGLLRLPANP